jgi:hypothetical protein
VRDGLDEATITGAILRGQRMSGTAPIELLFVLSLSATAAAGIFASVRRKTPAVQSYLVVIAGSALWTLDYALESLSQELQTKLFWDNLQTMGALLASAAVVVFSREYVGRRFAHRWRSGLLLTVFPLYHARDNVAVFLAHDSEV